MDLDSITVQDFKDEFPRGFPYLPSYDNDELYNIGSRVYYATTKLFYDCTVNGTTGILPTDTDNWAVVTGVSTEDYILDSDIEKAFAEAKVSFNQSLWGDDDQIKLGFLYLTAHYLVMDLKAAQGGVYGAGISGLVSSRSVGNVSEAYSIPQAYLDDPSLSFYTQSAYGIKYLNMVLPNIRGNIKAVCGATQP